MRGSTGIDLFGVIDPQLNWNTVPKGKHRVPRRPRTSLIDNKKLTKKKSQSEDIIDKGSVSGEMTISESEKLGVTILGHHFDGPIEGVPIKKRFQLVKTSYLSSLLVSDAPSQTFESPGGICQHSNPYNNTQSTGFDNSTEVADFSGISILAAAACDSTFSGDVLNSFSVSARKEPDIPEGLNDQSHEQGLCSASNVAGITVKVLPVKEADAAIADTDDPKESTSSHSSGKPKDNEYIGKVKTSRDIRLHWDLNKAMDAWECPENDESSPETAFPDNKVDMNDEKLVKTNSCSSSVGLQDVGCTSEPNSRMVSCNVNERSAAWKKEYQNTPKDAIVVEQNTNHFDKLLITYSSVENAKQPLPKVSAELPSCNTDSVVETEGSSSDEVSTRNTCTSNLKSAMTKTPIEASGNKNETVDSIDACSAGNDGTEKSPKEEKQAADHMEVSSLYVSVSSDNGDTVKDEYQSMDIEGAAAENRSLASQTRESVESQHPSVSNDCISEISVNPVQSHLSIIFETNVEEHNVCEKTDNIPANCEKESLCTSDQHEDFRSDLSSDRIENISVSVSSLGSIQRGVDRTVEHGKVGNQYDQGPVGMEKVELEDGELRESLFDWEFDGNEDGEMEHVDYDTDNKDMYMFEDSSDHLPSATLAHEDNPETKVVRTSSNNIPFKETTKFGSSPSLQSINNERVNVVDTATKGAAGRIECQISSEGGKADATIDTIIGCDGEREHLAGDHDNDKRSGNFVSLPKFSGWDQPLDGRDALRGGAVDADMESRRGHCSPNSISPGRKQHIMVKSSVVKDVSLRTDRTHPYKFSHNNVGTEIYDSRSHGRKDFNQSTERDGSRITSFSRSGPSIQMRERNKGGPWAESQSQSGSFLHEAPGFYTSVIFAKHGFKNAAEAAAARVAENGLVVAPDGTVVEPDHLDSTIRTPRRTSSTSSSMAARRSVSGRFSTGQRDAPLTSGRHSELRNLREISPSRHTHVGKARGEKYGPKVFTNGHRGTRYDGSNQREEFDAPLSGGQTFYQRDRSYSPHRGSFRIYACQTKSQSRSRTPPGWASPRQRGDNRRSGSSCFRRWSRSPPNFKSDVRSDDLRSPSRRSSFLDRAGDFIPPTKWASDRKDARDSFRQQEYRRPPGRSPPARPPSHIHGRPEADEYRQPMHHGRFRQFPGVGKRARFDRDENRGHDGRFDRFASPPRQNDGSGSRVKRLQYDTDGFGSLDSSGFQNDSEISGGGRSRGFNRAIDNEIQRSPRRGAAADRSHFRYETEVGAAKHVSYRGDETVNGPFSGKRG